MGIYPTNVEMPAGATNEIKFSTKTEPRMSSNSPVFHIRGLLLNLQPTASLRTHTCRRLEDGRNNNNDGGEGGGGQCVAHRQSSNSLVVNHRVTVDCVRAPALDIP